MTIEVRPRLWTREEYYKMGAAGIFPPDERVELIEGEVIRMSPRDPLHDNAISAGNMVFTRLFGDTHHVRVQLTLSLGEHSDPEPDFLLVPAAEAQRLLQERRHPTSGDLLVEVSHASLGYDRSVKVSLYARGGIPEYWILNLVDSCLEVYRQPRPEAEAPFGWNYAERLIFERGAQVAPNFASRPVSVSDLLPPDPAT